MYKRQVIDNARSVVEAVRKQKNYQENFPVKYIQMESDDAWARDVGPVSYTHLDVYKRQGFLFIFGRLKVPI